MTVCHLDRMRRQACAMPGGLHRLPLQSRDDAEVAEALGRRWVGIESNANYAGIALNRIERVLASPELSFEVT